VQPPPESIRRQLERLLASDAFLNARRLSRFLRYVVERSLAGERDRLKEYTIGIEVFDRDTQYDPRVDSIVRVEAGRLRSKLEEYYQGAGREDDVIINVQRGGYAPLFEARQTVPAAAPFPDLAGAKAPRSRPLWGSRRALAAGSATIVAVLAALAAWDASRSPPPPASAITLAVLPFSTYSGQAPDDALAALMTDGVTGELVQIGSLDVVSSASARRFAAIDRSLREVAAALDADLLMQGRVTAVGDSVTVEALLVDGKHDHKIWIEEFAGTTASIEELERRIAAAAANGAAKFAGRQTE